MNNKKNDNRYKIIDLFAGVGGIRLGFEKVFKDKSSFVFASEIDKFARQTYKSNYGHLPSGDITKIKPYEIPSFDILLAGFPCQPFSNAGLKKGFNDTRGTLFFDIAQIVKHHKPKVLFLENVKGFRNHDKGNTFKIVKKTLEDLGYRVFAEVLNARDFGVPQNRERIYIIAFLDDTNYSNKLIKYRWSTKIYKQKLVKKTYISFFEKLKGKRANGLKHSSKIKKIRKSKLNNYCMVENKRKNRYFNRRKYKWSTVPYKLTLIDFNHQWKEFCTKSSIDFQFPKPPKKSVKLGDILEKDVDTKYTISDKLWAGHQRRKLEHKKKGNGFGYCMFNEESKYTSTISARYYKDGSEILIEQQGKNPRKLSPREAGRLQGFPDNFKIVVSDTQAYKQFGNSVAVPVIEELAKEIYKYISYR